MVYCHYSQVRVFFSLLVLTGWAIHTPSAQAATPSIQVINKTAPGSSGQVALGTVTEFTTSLVNLADTLRDWQLQGAGTLAPSGTTNGYAFYTAPKVMPANPTVIVTAYMDSTPSATSSYTITLVNPVPAVTSATPAQLLTGGTQKVSLVGSGFVSGTTITFNGTTLPITFTDYYHASVQVPVPANATGTLTLQAQNPSPGGGAGSTFTVTVATPSISLTATDADGINTGTAELGVTVAMSAAVTGAVQTGVNWSVTGAGAISSAGVYTAPPAMPASQAVTIQASLASNPAVTASYTLNIVNPVPVITSASPATVSAGTTTAVTLTGNAFVPGTVVQVNGATAPTTYVSSTSVVAQITAPAGATALSLIGQNPSPGGGSSKTLSIPVASIQVINEAAPGSSGQVALGTVTEFTTSLVNLADTLRDWPLQGAGTLAPGGTTNGYAFYTAPTVMPANPTVIVTAYMNSTPSATSSYTITLVNPVPTVTSATPAQLLTGGTQTVALVGSGFVSGTTITFNGTTLPITFTNYYHASVQVPVPANATGTLSLQAQNPSPGGGAGSTFTVTVATPSISLTATDADGINTGTAELGVTVAMSAAVTGAVQTGVNWSVTGAGAISSAGVYTAPPAMPASQAVTIQASLASNPAVTASYTLNIVNPVPVITSASPATVSAGTTTAVTLTGNAFVPGTVVQVNGATAPTTYVSSTSVVAQITAPAGATALSLIGQNPSPGGGSSKTLSIPVASIQVINEAAPGSSGQVALGTVTEFTTSLVNLADTLRDWPLQGAGTLAPGGTTNGYAFYTAPTVMPANPTVIVTAYMNSTPSATSSYTITLVNPVPTVTSATPAQLLTGGTQTVSLVGSGFVSGTTITFNGTTLPITFTDYYHASVQVPVPANATGTLSLQAQNPSPGGGAGSTFTESIVPNSIALTATDADGTNTGTAELGVTVTMSAAVTGAVQTGVNWSVTGAGAISSSGVYTAPASLPANQAVTIKASLASNSAVTASYALNIVYPVPFITSASPATVPAGTTTSVTLTGTGFVPATVIQVNGATVPATYISPTSVVAQVPAGPGTIGSLALQSQNPTPGGGLGPEFEEAIATPISATAAARLLDQTSFGPTTSLIQQVQQEGVTAWLTQQFNTAPTTLAYIPLTGYPSYCNIAEFCLESEWWQAVLTGNDQLRQRVAFALSEIFVVSSAVITGQGINDYANTLANDAFTNWYTIMNDVTLSPAMGQYLNMLNNQKPTATLIADENFARENMQLFNLGLNLINQDGSPKLDANGNPIPTYTEAQVQAFARVYTGWTYANADGSTPTGLVGTPNPYHPLVAVERYHDENPKTVLNGTTLPAGQTAEADLAAAETNIFNHPNLPPFVCKQLIQHLVKSDPSPAYVSRVAAVFINDGNNVRGDMQAVLTAIFTDPEARAGDTSPQASDGHLREPILWLTAVMRGLGYVNVDPNNYYRYLSNYTQALGELPYQSPAVFNFFPPSYVIPGTTLNAPEFALENTGSVSDKLGLADKLVDNMITGFNVDLSASSPLGQVVVSQGPAALVNALNALFLYGTMDSNTADAITDEIATSTNPAQQVRLAVYLTITSSEYKILH